MLKEQAMKLENGNRVINTETNIELEVSINHVKNEGWDLIECRFLEPRYGWCNINYNKLELV